MQEMDLNKREIETPLVLCTTSIREIGGMRGDNKIISVLLPALGENFHIL